MSDKLKVVVITANGGVVNTVSISPGQGQKKKNWANGTVSFNEEGAMEEATRLRDTWHQTYPQIGSLKVEAR